MTALANFRGSFLPVLLPKGNKTKQNKMKQANKQKLNYSKVLDQQNFALW